MAQPLRIPAVLAFTVLGAGFAAAAGCGKDPPRPDAACVFCVPIPGNPGTGCAAPTCATGPDQDVCPDGCEPQPPS